MPAPWQPPDNLTLSARSAPWHAMDALLAHTTNLGYEYEGYPANFDPVVSQLTFRGLHLASSYWHCRASLSEAEIAQWIPIPDRGLTGTQEELQQLAEVAAQHYVRRPGDIVYFPIVRTESSPGPGMPSRSYYSDFIILAYDYPPARLADDYIGAQRMEMVLDAAMARSGPYVAVKPLNALPAAIGQRFVLDNQMIDIMQRGGHITLQISPNSLFPMPQISGQSIFTEVMPGR